MHMADALLSPAVGLTMLAVSAASVAYTVKKLDREDVEEKRLPYMAVLGAFVFAAQMINFTIPLTGSSGHLGGGVLLAALLGPGPAYLTISAVLIIQALFFADGGLLALGCNLFNMGVLPCLLVYPLLFRPLLNKGVTAGRLSVAAVLAAIVALQAGAFAVVLETLLSGVTALPFDAFLLLMQPIHLAIGAVEGLVTAAILGFVWKLRPELLEAGHAGQRPAAVGMRPIVAFALLAVLIGGGLSLLASGYPDGLEWAVAHTAGGTELAAAGAFHAQAAALQESAALLPDYDFAAGEGPVPGVSVAGLAGCVLTVALAVTAGALVRLAKKRRAAPQQ